MIDFRPGPHWQEGEPFSEQDLRPLGAYMKSLYDGGILRRGGPVTDDAGGVAIVAVPNGRTADRLLQ